MSFPTIPRIAPTISLSRTQVINLLLASVALEELGLAHIINAEGEKLQAVLERLPGLSVTASSFAGLISINREVRRTLQTALKSQMLLQFKLEEILQSSETVPSIPVFIDAGSAWSVGTQFGNNPNSGYTTLICPDKDKTVVLGLGHNHIDIGDVYIHRNGTILSVTITTDSPYIMDQVHLYVSNVAPDNSAPGSFPYSHTVTDQNEYFTTWTFDNINVDNWTTIYVAAHAHILIQQ